MLRPIRFSLMICIQFDDMPTERRISFRVKLQKLKERK